MVEAVTIWLVSIWGLEGALGCTAAAAGMTEAVAMGFLAIVAIAPRDDDATAACDAVATGTERAGVE